MSSGILPAVMASSLSIYPNRPARIGAVGAACGAALLALAASPETHAQAASLRPVRICTEQGRIEVELDQRNAPLQAANFARYVESGFYNGTVFHRVVPDAIVQGGGYDLNLEPRRPGAVANEPSGAAGNRRGTIAAARAEGSDSATAQFFFKLTDNGNLDASADAPGYTVFGRVTAGLDVLDAISALPTAPAGGLPDVPTPLIELESVTLLERASPFAASIEGDPVALRAELERARAGRDPAAVLAAIDTLRRGCLELDGPEHLLEAEAAVALGRVDRARHGLEQFIAKTYPADPDRARAERLYASLPAAAGDVDSLLAHCERPLAPTLPDGRDTELEVMQAVESAVRRYRQQGDAYLGCVSAVIDGGTLGDAETTDAVARHNEAVLEMTGVLSEFNAAVQTFKASRQEVRSSPR
jgi:cyclophilin family peptidyl-prolyl cis-trans isomerase